MKVLLAIPSKKRAEVFMKNAYPWVSQLKGELDWCVFLEPEDVGLYMEAGVPPENIYNIGESNRGLGFSKQEIKKYAMNFGYTHIFKIDDDINGWTDFRQRTKTPEENAKRFRQIIADCLGEMTNPAVVAISFPYSFQMFERFKWKKTKRVQTAYITTTEYFHADPEISVFEDFVVGMNAIVNNKLVLTYGLSGIQMGVKVGGDKNDNTGGLQAFDRKAKTLEVLPKLREIYPPLKFKKVNKIWAIEPDLRSIKGIGYY